MKKEQIRGKRKKYTAFLTGVLAFAMTVSYFSVPNSFSNGSVAEAIANGESRTFNNTTTGRLGTNVANTTGDLDGDVTVNGGIYYWTVPETGFYRIEAFGAQGGNTTTAAKSKGLGAKISGELPLTKGQVLKILVGQEGTSHSYIGGGGGGTFVTTNTNEPIIVAGGGGGASRNASEPPLYRNAWTKNDGQRSTSSSAYAKNGAGGSNGHPYWGDGGGGLTGNGYGETKSFVNGGAGGTGNVPGGFGGGGSGKYSTISSCSEYNYDYTQCIGTWTYTYYGGPGGGGGYSGGASSSTGGGAASHYNNGEGGGGGSYVSPTLVTRITATSDGFYNGDTNFNGEKIETNSDYNASHGTVTITQILPEIATQLPANATKFQNNYVDVSWEPEKLLTGMSISKYEIKAGTTSGGTNLVAVTNKGTVKTHRIIVPAGTPGNTTIYWSVRTYDHAGNVGPWKQQTVIYSNNMPTITATTNTPAKLDVSLEKRNHAFSINSLKDSDDFNYVTLFADVLDGSGNVIAGSKKQIVLDSSLVNSTQLISGTSSEKDGSLQGPVDYKTPFGLKLALQPDFTTGKFDLTLTKADGVTNVIKSGAKLLTGRAMQASSATNAENYTLRIYPEDRQNTNTLAASPLAGVNDVAAITIPFASDTRNYLPNITNLKHDVANRVFSEAEGFNRISVTGHVDDSDPADVVTMYYEVQPKADNYAIQVTTTGGKVVPRYGKEAGTFQPKVDNDFAFTYPIGSDLDSGDYALLVYGYDSQEGIGDYVEISFTVNRDGPTIDFVANYTTPLGQTIAMSSAQKQIVAEDNKVKLYFTPNNYATFEYAGYLVRAGVVKDLRIRGAFTNEVNATFIGVDLGKDTITLLNGEQTDFKLGDVLVFKFKATSATGIVTQKDVRILIGNDQSTFAPINDANIPNIP